MRKYELNILRHHLTYMKTAISIKLSKINIKLRKPGLDYENHSDTYFFHGKGKKCLYILLSIPSPFPRYSLIS